MTYSAFLVALRNSAQKGRQGANRAVQQVQRPIPNQTQRATSTQTSKMFAKPKTLEEQYDFLALDVSLGRL